MRRYADKTFWEKRADIYRKRGRSGGLNFIAERELHAAANLWKTYMADGVGWTVELGAGYGRFWEMVPPPAKLILLDIIPILLKALPERHRVVADAQALPFPSRSLNQICALGLTEYLPDLLNFLINLRRSAQDGARLLFSSSPPTVPNRLRKWSGFRAIPRPDPLVKAVLIAAGWRLLRKEPLRAGWQSLWVVEAY